MENKAYQEIVSEKITVLATFKQNICLWYDDHSGSSRTDLLRSQIKQNAIYVRSIIEETSCLKLISLTPVCLGKPTVRDYDPFNSVLNHTYIGVPCIPAIVEMIDEATGVLKSPRYLARLLASSTD